MQNKNLEQIRTVIKMFFNEYDMEDIYNYIDRKYSRGVFYNTALNICF